MDLSISTKAINPATLSSRLKSEATPLKVSTLTHTSFLVLECRMDLRQLAVTLPVGTTGEAGEIVCIRFCPMNGEAVERGDTSVMNRAGKRDFGSQLQLRMRTQTGLFVQIKVFSTGALATTGARSEEDALFSLSTFETHLEGAGLKVKSRSPAELRNALCTGFVGLEDYMWNVDLIFEIAEKEKDPAVVAYRIKSRGKAAILEIGCTSVSSGHAPRCIIHPSGSVQIMGKVVPALANDVYEQVKRFLHKVLAQNADVFLLSTSKPKPKRKRKIVFPETAGDECEEILEESRPKRGGRKKMGDGAAVANSCSTSNGIERDIQSPSVSKSYKRKSPAQKRTVNTEQLAKAKARGSSQSNVRVSTASSTSKSVESTPMRPAGRLPDMEEASLDDAATLLLLSQSLHEFARTPPTVQKPWSQRETSMEGMAQQDRVESFLFAGTGTNGASTEAKRERNDFALFGNRQSLA